MNIFAFAMKREKEHARYYATLARKAKLPGLKRVFTMLAADEEKHYRTVRAMKKGISPKVARTAILGKAQAVFAKVSAETAAEYAGLDPVGALKKAQANEEKSRVFYLKKSKEAVSKGHRDLFLILSGEEEKHRVLIGNLIDFISGPEAWIENAEFNHLEDY
jgi:rubrerythrin